MDVLDRGRDHVLALFRIVVGLLFAFHGLQSLFGLFGSKSVSLAAWPGGPAALIQLIGGVLIVLGLGTRVAALVASGSMAYAYFVVHQPLAPLPIQNKGELAALYSWVFVLLAFTGPGSWAVDRVLATKRKQPELATA
ncbi:DoxX family protein [Actinosynnema sp. NPDC020468]|uniref:DoxX family protein n=1 Tax=Actinosynnema sp. NPDC020468 TaxID=3154488 RepID=UPI0034010157